jgi:hypothetical protein
LNEYSAKRPSHVRSEAEGTIPSSIFFRKFTQSFDPPTENLRCPRCVKPAVSRARAVSSSGRVPYPKVTSGGQSAGASTNDRLRSLHDHEVAGGWRCWLVQALKHVSGE